MTKEVIVLLTALAVTAGLTGCQRDNYGLDKNGNAREVKAQFVFNISTLSGKQTKQTSEQTQAGGSDFRGITDAKLMTMARPNKDGEILIEDADVDHIYDFSNMVRAGQITSENSRRVLEMSLPLNTNTLLFYGRAVRGSNVPASPEGLTVNDCYGHLDKYNVSDKEGETYFQLGKRLEDDKKVLFYATEKLIAGIQTLVMNTNLAGDNHVTIASDGTPSNCSKPYGYTLNKDKLTLEEGGYPEIYWSSYVNDNKKSPVDPSHSLFPLEEKLANLYKEMTTILSVNNDELRAGSGEATIRIIKDMWSIINTVRCAEPTCEAEAVAKYFAEQVNIRLAKYFTATVAGDGKPVVVSDFQPLATIINNMDTQVEKNNWPSGIPDEVKLTEAEKDALKASGVPAKLLYGFPSYFNLPVGATYVVIDEQKKYYSYPKVFNTTSMSSGGPYNAENYFYPAELLYFANSPLRACDKEQVETNYPKTSASWNNPDSWPSKDKEDNPLWDGYHVKSSTRSVAMMYDIDYGVSMLETKVGYSTLTLKDNRKAVMKEKGMGDSETDQEIKVGNETFQFTGLVIGGQPMHVGWNYLPCNAPNLTTYQDGFVYDKAVVNQMIPNATTSASESNYTVVFDNFNASAYKNQQPQDKVNVALEFLNNSGVDFYGNHNLIRNGGHFYLIGTLDPNDENVEKFNWPTTGAIVPPYTSEGQSAKVTRIFIQDYKTTVTFKFGENSLKYAYITVPDLRSSSLTLGLSVDIVWQKGLVYKEVILGGN